MPSDSARSGPWEITSKRFDDLSPTQLHAILQLRSLVFVVEQACVYNDIDGRDIESGTRHHWIEADGVITSYARELRDGETKRIGRVVTDPRHRGSGQAADLVTHIRDNSTDPTFLDAQSYLADWYAALGFTIVGDEYVEDGIPHVPMRSNTD